MIEVTRLCKRFGSKTVLQNLDFKVAPGEFVALLGPNGAGKSTLLRILASLLRPSLGKVCIANHFLPGEAAAVRRQLGVVSHQPLLYADLNARENLIFYGRLYDIPRVGQRVDDILELIGLTGRSHDPVRTFSRGMQQRLAIGRAVLHDPEVLLLDEPHTGLDQDACQMLDGILRLVANQGRTVVMASHDLARATYLANRFDVLSRGSLKASVRKEDLPIDGLLAFYRKAIMNPQSPVPVKS